MYVKPTTSAKNLHHSPSCGCAVRRSPWDLCTPIVPGLLRRRPYTPHCRTTSLRPCQSRTSASNLRIGTCASHWLARVVLAGFARPAGQGGPVPRSHQGPLATALHHHPPSMKHLPRPTSKEQCVKGQKRWGEEGLWRAAGPAGPVTGGDGSHERGQRVTAPPHHVVARMPSNLLAGYVPEPRRLASVGPRGRRFPAPPPQAIALCCHTVAP